MAEFSNNPQQDRQPTAMQEPAPPRREADIIKEQIAIRRFVWIRSHMTLLYTIIGVIFVAAIVLLILFYTRQTNPMNRLMQASAKVFDSSFDFTVTMSESDTPRMSYKGSVNVDRGKHLINAVYDADYVDYTFSGALVSKNNKAVRGSYYKEKWAAEDCTDRMRDFFDFDADFRQGVFDGGALLRFLELSSEFNAEELNRFEGKLRHRIYSDENFSKITTVNQDGGVAYTQDVNLSALGEMLIEDGASLFCHATDYDSLKKRLESNQLELERSHCQMRYFIDAKGYLTQFSLRIDLGEESYAVDCGMNNFGTAEVLLPEEFIAASDKIFSEE